MRGPASSEVALLSALVLKPHSPCRDLFHVHAHDPCRHRSSDLPPPPPHCLLRFPASWQALCFVLSLLSQCHQTGPDLPLPWTTVAASPHKTHKLCTAQVGTCSSELERYGLRSACWRGRWRVERVTLHMAQWNLRAASLQALSHAVTLKSNRFRGVHAGGGGDALEDRDAWRSVATASREAEAVAAVVVELEVETSTLAGVEATVVRAAAEDELSAGALVAA